MTASVHELGTRIRTLLAHGATAVNVQMLTKSHAETSGHTAVGPAGDDERLTLVYAERRISTWELAGEIVSPASNRHDRGWARQAVRAHA